MQRLTLQHQARVVATRYKRVSTTVLHGEFITPKILVSILILEVSKSMRPSIRFLKSGRGCTAARKTPWIHFFPIYSFQRKLLASFIMTIFRGAIHGSPSDFSSFLRPTNPMAETLMESPCAVVDHHRMETVSLDENCSLPSFFIEPDCFWDIVCKDDAGINDDHHDNIKNKQSSIGDTTTVSSLSCHSSPHSGPALGWMMVPPVNVSLRCQDDVASSPLSSPKSLETIALTPPRQYQEEPSTTALQAPESDSNATINISSTTSFAPNPTRESFFNLDNNSNKDPTVFAPTPRFVTAVSAENNKNNYKSDTTFSSIDRFSSGCNDGVLLVPPHRVVRYGSPSLFPPSSRAVAPFKMHRPVAVRSSFATHQRLFRYTSSRDDHDKFFVPI